jgi:predicted GNAT family N-acyltransferase
MLRVEIKNVNELSPETVSLIERDCHREFGNDSMVYAYPEIYILGYVNGELISHVGLLQRRITVKQKPLLIAGMGFLITEPDSRNQGFGTTVMKAATAYVKNELALPFGLLTCKPRLESLYAGIGWRTISEPNVFVQPTGNRSCGGLIMIIECGGLPWPKGEIDLCGLPW